MNIKNKSLLEIHAAVLLFGMAGLFGKFLSLPSLTIVFGRVLFSSIFLGIIVLAFGESFRLNHKKDYLYLIIQGIILAVHWYTFFKSIQVSTVAIGLLTFSTFPVFVTFMEPYFLREKIKLRDILLAAFTFLGVTLVVPKFNADNNLALGALWGVASGFTFAVLSLFNKKYVREYSSRLVAFYQQVSTTVVLAPFLFITPVILHIKDMLLILLLGVVFTGISHTLFINSLKKIKAHTAGIVSSLEPVYGIILAALLLNEIPSVKTISGGVIILGTALYSSLKS